MNKKILWFVFICSFIFVSCSSNSDDTKETIDNSNQIVRSSAIANKDNKLFIISTYSNQILSWDKSADSLNWEQNTTSHPQRVFYKKSEDKIYVTLPEEGSINVYNTDGSLESTNEYYQQPFALIWLEHLDEWIISDTGLNRLWVADKNLDAKYFIELSGQPRAIAYDGNNSHLLVASFLEDDLYIFEHNTTWRLKEKKLLNQKATLAQNIEIYNDEILIPHQRSNSDFDPLRFDDIVRPLVTRFTRDELDRKSKDVLALHIIDKTVSKPIDIRVDSNNSYGWILNANSNDISVVDLDTNQLVVNISTGKQPSSIYLDEVLREAYVYNALSYTLEVFDMDSFESKSSIQIGKQIVSNRVQLGMEVFFDSTDPRAMEDRWLSCENCHPDGKQDGQLWQQGLGPRNTTSMEGVKFTGRLHWTGDRDEIQDFEHTFRDLMAGIGFVNNPPTELGEKIANKSIELDAMAEFLETLDFPKPLKEHFLDINASKRGKIIFESSQTRCLECHSGKYFTDSNESKLHNVGTFSREDDIISGPELDTPSLKGLSFSAPYLHDSTADTLLQVLTTKNKDDLHGKTSHLSEDELDDLVEYLKSL